MASLTANPAGSPKLSDVRISGQVQPKAGSHSDQPPAFAGQGAEREVDERRPKN